jgi:hypothetical protein
MSTRRAGDLVLAADMSGFGDFASIGVMREPSMALAACIGELQGGEADENRRPVLVHVIATKIAGRCVIPSVEGEAAAQASLLLGIAVEWRITIPRAGALQALFLVKRLQNVDEPGRIFDMALQLAGKPAYVSFEREEPLDS